MTLVSVGAGAVGNRTYGVGGDRDFFPTPWDYVKSFATENTPILDEIP